MYDDIVTGHPVDWGCDPVLVASLKGVEHAQDLGGVAASRRGVRKNQSDGLLGIDDEYLHPEPCQFLSRICFRDWGIPTDRMVNAMPLESTLVMSWWSSLHAGSDWSRGLREWANLHVVQVCDLPLLVANDGERQVAT